MSSSNTLPYGLLQAKDIFALKDGLIVIACQYVFLGIYATLVMSAVYLLASRGLQALSRKLLLIVIIIMFVSSTVISVIRIIFQLQLVNVYRFPPFDPSRLIIKLTSVSNCLERLNYMLSDTIVVWRAWIFFPGNLKVKIALCFCMLASVAGAVVDGVFTVFDEVNANGLALPAGAGTLILTLPLLITNMFATSLVAVKTWMYRREVRMRLGGATKSTSVENVLILLVESGLVYCSLWVLVVITRYRLLSDLAFDVMFAVFPHLTGIYPVCIVLLATLEKTHAESIMSGQDSNSTIRFERALTQRAASTAMEDLCSGAASPSVLMKQEGSSTVV